MQTEDDFLSDDASSIWNIMDGSWSIRLKYIDVFLKYATFLGISNQMWVGQPNKWEWNIGFQMNFNKILKFPTSGFFWGARSPTLGLTTTSLRRRAGRCCCGGDRWSSRRSERRVAESGPAPPAAEEKPPVGCLLSNLQVNNHQAASQPLQEKSSAKELKKKKSLSETWHQLKPNTPLYKAEELQRNNFHLKKKNFLS